ncbi:hypothetical protein [Marinobacter sp.]|uniref:hypothetical protein n=1 Tax=Marinobacter sp. TaxID=50741 RepID=UPI003299FF57
METGRAAELQLGRELRDLGTARRKAEALDQEALRTLKAQVAAERQTQRERLEAHRMAERATLARLTRLMEENAAKAEVERNARGATEAEAQEIVGQRDLREIASGSAVAAAEGAGRPILPKREWTPVERKDRSTSAKAAAAAAASVTAARTSTAAAAAATTYVPAAPAPAAPVSAAPVPAAPFSVAPGSVAPNSAAPVLVAPAPAAPVFAALPVPPRSALLST